MSKEKLAAAKQFIEEKQYKEARLILESTDHPKATEWLSRLPKPAQPEKLKNSQSSKRLLTSPIMVLGMIVLLFITFSSGVFIGQIMSDSPMYPIDMPRKPITTHGNSTTEALIYATQTAAAED